MAGMMGFKKVDSVPRSRRIKGRSIYDPVIKEVHESGGTYMLDTKDHKRATSLVTTLRQAIRRNKFDDVKVCMRYTQVYVTRKEEGNDD